MACCSPRVPHNLVHPPQWSVLDLLIIRSLGCGYGGLSWVYGGLEYYGYGGRGCSSGYGPFHFFIGFKVYLIPSSFVAADNVSSKGKENGPFHPEG